MTCRDHDPEPEDLSALSRRGLLSEAEERELVRALAENATLRAAHAVGLDFDRSTAVRAGDEALVARSAERALAQVAARAPSPKRRTDAGDGAAPVGRILWALRKRPRRMVPLLAAALLIASGVAADMWSGLVPARWFTSSGPEDGKPPVEEAARTSPPPASKHEGAEPLPDPNGVASASNLRSVLAVDNGAQIDNGADAVPRARPGRSSSEATAAELFRAGNAARHAADFSRAERLYSELIAKHPNSEEARIARVSLGKLLLAKGDATAAEHEFRQYLKGGGGQLAEEALVSRAHSLQKLRRAQAERLTWQRLLADHPDTVYSAEARARLRVLGDGE